MDNGNLPRRPTLLVYLKHLNLDTPYLQYLPHIQVRSGLCVDPMSHALYFVWYRLLARIIACSHTQVISLLMFYRHFSCLSSGANVEVNPRLVPRDP